MSKLFVLTFAPVTSEIVTYHACMGMCMTRQGDSQAPSNYIQHSVLVNIIESKSQSRKQAVYCSTTLCVFTWDFLST